MPGFRLNQLTPGEIVSFPTLTKADQARCEAIALYRAGFATKYPKLAKPLRLRQASMGARSGRMLTRFIKHLQPQSILEIGTCAGIGAAYMCTAAEAVGQRIRFVGMEGVPEKTKIALETLGYFCENTDIHIEHGHFDDTFEVAVEKAGPLQFVYLDGRHKKRYTLHMFNYCVTNMPQGGVIVCDDLFQPLQGNVSQLLRKNSRVRLVTPIANKLAFIIKEDPDAAISTISTPAES